MASSAWKGFITFGLISIPIRLYAAARSYRMQLHQLHSVCKTRLRQPLFCPTCNKIVERSEVVKGYEYDDGKYVLIDPEEIKKIAPQSARSMEILAFVKESEIDPLFFDSSFFAVPEGEGRKAYQLLLKTLEATNRVGIAKVAMHQREYTVFIRPYDHGLTLHTMYFANEVREAPGYGKTEDIKLKPQEIKLAEQLVENLSEEFRLEKYHDEFQDRLKQLIESKQEGREVAAAPAPHRAPVIDMMEALKKSLAASGASSKKPLHADRLSESHRRGSRRAAS
ncbi:MAG: non-homologous end joining protein Ku [Candidatus Acidiferrales bacterium]